MQESHLWWSNIWVIKPARELIGSLTGGFENRDKRERRERGKKNNKNPYTLFLHQISGHTSVQKYYECWDVKENSVQMMRNLDDIYTSIHFTPPDQIQVAVAADRARRTTHLLHSHSLCLLQMGHVIPPVCSGSVLTCPPSWTCSSSDSFQYQITCNAQTAIKTISTVG